MIAGALIIALTMIAAWLLVPDLRAEARGGSIEASPHKGVIDHKEWPS